MCSCCCLASALPRQGCAHSKRYQERHATPPEDLPAEQCGSSSQACPSQAPALQGLTLKRHIDATLGRGRVREAVALPPGEDLNEWLAVNAVDFYNAIAVLYGTLTEFCTRSSCPLMSAGPKVRTQAVHSCTSLFSGFSSTGHFYRHMHAWHQDHFRFHGLFLSRLYMMAYASWFSCAFINPMWQTLQIAAIFLPSRGAVTSY